MDDLLHFPAPPSVVAMSASRPYPDDGRAAAASIKGGTMHICLGLHRAWQSTGCIRFPTVRPTGMMFSGLRDQFAT